MSHDAAKGMTTYVSQPGIQQTHLDALNRESPLNRQQSDLFSHAQFVRIRAKALARSMAFQWRFGIQAKLSTLML